MDTPVSTSELAQKRAWGVRWVSGTALQLLQPKPLDPAGEQSAEDAVKAFLVRHHAPGQGEAVFRIWSPDNAITARVRAAWDQRTGQFARHDDWQFEILPRTMDA